MRISLLAVGTIALAVLSGCEGAPIRHNLPFLFPEVRCDDARTGKLYAEDLAKRADQEGRTADAAYWRERAIDHEATAKRWCEEAAARQQQ